MASGSGAFMEISIQFEGQREIVGRFFSLGMASRSVAPAMEQVGLMLQRDWEHQFEAEGGYLGAKVGPKWAPLAASTVKDRIRKRFPGAHPILVREGGLEASIVRRGAAHNVFEVGDDHVRVGTTHPIAPYQQYGTRGRRVGTRHDYYSAKQGVYLKGHPGGAWVDSAVYGGGIPPRVMIALAWDARSRITRIIGDYVRGQVAAAFGGGTGV